MKWIQLAPKSVEVWAFIDFPFGFIIPWIPVITIASLISFSLVSLISIIATNKLIKCWYQNRKMIPRSSLYIYIYIGNWWHTTSVFYLFQIISTWYMWRHIIFMVCLLIKLPSSLVLLLPIFWFYWTPSGYVLSIHERCNTPSLFPMRLISNNLRLNLCPGRSLSSHFAAVADIAWYRAQPEPWPILLSGH